MDVDHNIDKNLSDKLGIKSHDLAEKCIKYALFLVNKVSDDKITEDDILEFMRTTFSYNELIYFSTMYLTDKTHKILDNPMAKMLIQMMAKHKE